MFTTVPVILQRDQQFMTMAGLYSSLRQAGGNIQPAPLRKTLSLADLPSVTGPLVHPPRFNFGRWTLSRQPPIYFMGPLPQDSLQNIRVVCCRIANDILQERGPYFTVFMFRQRVGDGTLARGFTISAIPLHTPFEAFAVALAFDQHMVITPEEQRTIAGDGFRLVEPAILADEGGTPFFTVNRVSHIDPMDADAVQVPAPPIRPSPEPPIRAPPTYAEAMHDLSLGAPTAQQPAATGTTGATGTSGNCPNCAALRRGKGRSRRGKK